VWCHIVRAPQLRRQETSARQPQKSGMLLEPRDCLALYDDSIVVTLLAMAKIIEEIFPT